ncbi:MAG: sugar phosphate isomerase/epimerase, partial [Planctomycetia bacterium]|nr:sugar phosphate isomerase/epimerase [Planctomycetia bacterium]
MSDNLISSRRAFFGQCGVAVAGATMVAADNNKSFAAEPPKRNGKSHMKLSLAAYSFNKFLVNRGTAEQIAAAKMKLEDFIQFCADQNLDGTELTSYYFPKEVTPALLRAIKEQTFRLGL